MIPGATGQNENEDLSIENMNFRFGLYVQQINLTLKTTNHLPNVISGQRIEFSPVMCFELKGCSVNFVSIGESLVDVNVGLASLIGFLVSKGCICTTKTTQTTIAEIPEESNYQVRSFLFIISTKFYLVLVSTRLENNKTNLNTT